MAPESGSETGSSLGTAIDVPTEVTPPPAPNWVAIAAFAVSLGALLKSFLTDLKAGTTRKAAAFETHYAAPIRNGLRSYEKTLQTLRAFSLSNPNTVESQKEEIAKLRADWLNASFEMATLLKEADDSGKLGDPCWADRFQARADEAEAMFLEMTEPNTSASDIKALATKSREILSLAVVEIRADLMRELATYDTFFAWWKK